MPTLSELQIELAGMCNVACSYCTWQKRTTGRALMDTKLALRLLDEVALIEPKPLVTLHSVGESTLHPDLVEIVQKAQSLGLQTRLSSNCVILQAQLASALAAITGLQMILAIHSGLPAKTRTSAIENALDYLASRPANRSVHVLSVCAVDHSLSPRWFVDTFLEMIERLPQAKLHFKQPCTWPKSEPVYGLIPNLPAHPQIEIDRSKTPYSLGRICTMPHYFLAVQADGTTAPCCLGQDDWGLQSAEYRSVQDIWTSPRMAQLRDLWHEASDSIPCGHCLKRTDC